jgi:hypothetical protein
MLKTNKQMRALAAERARRRREEEQGLEHEPTIVANSAAERVAAEHARQRREAQLQGPVALAKFDAAQRYARRPTPIDSTSEHQSKPPRDDRTFSQRAKKAPGITAFDGDDQEGADGNVGDSKVRPDRAELTTDDVPFDASSLQEGSVS